ncbi:hypothetical protein AXF23_13410 [Prevotella sp. oral taxon 313]|nr:hypothetical protein AXF23_13410 [Prevotella sp. oral taxon 313]
MVCRKRLLIPLYKNKVIDNRYEHDENVIIYMVQPETTFSGGLSDRLRGITSIYGECKRKNLPFKIVFEPLHLQDYLVPNQYDWQIEAKNICWDLKKVYPCTLLTYNNNLENSAQINAQKKILQYYLNKSYKQIHIYSNMAIADNDFSVLFNELFRPSERLQNQIDYHLNKLGGEKKYISLTFRFRQLLGDFKEGGYILPESEREAYILKCIKGVVELHLRYPTERILVTSDSKMFLDRLCHLEYVYVIPGKVVHMGFTFDASQDTYIKSFIDYFMLSNAKKVFQMTDKLLFRSGFPKRAAMLTNAPYEEIELL